MSTEPKDRALQGSFIDLRVRLRRRRQARVEVPSGCVEASVAAILAPRPSGAVDLLLIERAARPDDPWSGQMALPGGRRDPEDADPVATVVREVREEVGLDLPRGSFLGALDELHPRTPSIPPVLVRPFVFGLPSRPDLTPGDEVAACLWVPLTAFERARGNAIVTIRGKLEQVPAYLVTPTPVWGITHRVLEGLLLLAAAA